MKNVKAFTLIELLIVIVIIGVLSAAVSIAYVNHLKNARCSRILQDFDAISKAAQTQYQVAGLWALDVNQGVAPTFVPEYLSTWPSGNFYDTGYYYDWEVWPTITTDPDFAKIKAISFRDPNSTPIRFDELYYYCVQDDRTNQSDCNWTGVNAANPPPALNEGGTCP